MRALTYWSSGEGLGHITPPGCDWPEGFDVLSWIKETFNRYGRVLEFGCGRGRLAGGFSDEQYLGVDVSEPALALAHAANPEKAFLLLSQKSPPLPRADSVMAYAVLLHVPDEEIQATIQRLVNSSPVVYVIEIMGRQWRRPGNPPVFNRNEAEYVAMFYKAGAKAVVTETKPCVRYPGSVFTVIRAHEINDRNSLIVGTSSP